MAHMFFLKAGNFNSTYTFNFATRQMNQKILSSPESRLNVVGFDTEQLLSNKPILAIVDGSHCRVNESVAEFRKGRQKKHLSQTERMCSLWKADRLGFFCQRTVERATCGKTDPRVSNPFVYKPKKSTLRVAGFECKVKGVICLLIVYLEATHTSGPHSDGEKYDDLVTYAESKMLTSLLDSLEEKK